MDIVVRAQDFAMSEAINRFARTELESALWRLGHDIQAVDVFLKDINGAKNGVDKQALIRVRLGNRHVVAVETTHEDLYLAISEGARRTRETVHRYLGKSRRILRQSLREYLHPAKLPAPG